MSGHTPGPWFVSDYDWTTVYVKLGDTEPGVASTAGEPFATPDKATQRANARLIAAAPELLEALNRCRFDSLNMSLADLDFCRAAIAKATGAAP